MTVAQLIAFMHIGVVFTYLLMAASPFPMADPLLERADVSLGFHWLSWFTWIDQHPMVRLILPLAYYSMGLQALVLITFYAYVNGERVDEAIIAGMMAIVVIFPLQYVLPSIGAFAPHGMTSVVNFEEDILSMRSHAVLTVDATKGIVTFPSYHTALAVVLTNMARGHKRMFYPLLALNFVLMISVMSVGGHYLVDLISGFAVAFVALGATQFLLSRCAQRPVATEKQSIRVHAPSPS